MILMHIVFFEVSAQCKQTLLHVNLRRVDQLSQHCKPVQHLFGMVVLTFSRL